ncbi:MAG: TolB family protein [Chloroflexota bacterium]
MALALRRIAALLLIAAGLWGCNLANRAGGAPAAGNPAAGTPAAGTPAAGSPADATPGAAGSVPGETSQPGGGATPLAASTVEAGSLQVAYIKDGDLWLWAGGERRRLTNQPPVIGPQLSADGQWIAFRRPADNFHDELWVARSDGTDERRLVSVADLDAIGGGYRDPGAAAINPQRYAWIGGSHRLAFNTRQVYNGPGIGLLDDFHIVDAGSGALQNVLLPGWGGEFVLSPDAAQVALAQADAIYLANLDGSGYRQVFSYSPVATYSEYRYYAAPVWTPDGSLLRLALPPADPLAEPRQPTGLWQLSAGGGDAVQQGSLPAAPFFEFSQDFGPPVSYSPDLARLAYLRERGSGAESTRQLVIAGFDGQGEQVAAEDRLLRFFGWAPGGERFAFTQGELQELHLGRPGGDSQPALAAPYAVHDLRWVDEARLLVVQQQADGFYLLLIDLQGGLSVLDVLSEPPGFDFSVD